MHIFSDFDSASNKYGTLNRWKKIFISSSMEGHPDRGRQPGGGDGAENHAVGLAGLGCFLGGHWSPDHTLASIINFFLASGDLIIVYVLNEIKKKNAKELLEHGFV